jgi:hypothetical protein
VVIEKKGPMSSRLLPLMLGQQQVAVENADALSALAHAKPAADDLGGYGVAVGVKAYEAIDIGAAFMEEIDLWDEEWKRF